MQNSARRPPTLGPSPRTWAIGPPLGSYKTISTIAIIITQPESWYSFYHPREGRRLSRPRWLVLCPDGLSAREQSPIQVVRAVRWAQRLAVLYCFMKHLLQIYRPVTRHNASNYRTIGLTIIITDRVKKTENIDIAVFAATVREFLVSAHL